MWTFLILITLVTEHANGQLSVSLRRKETAVEDVEVSPPLSRATILGQVPELIKNYRNVYYYGSVKVGTPGDTLRVVFDTGSPSLWVYAGSGWSSWTCLPCWFHKTYRHSRSSTYVAEGKPVAINYVSSYIRGFTSKDKLTIGNLSVAVTFAEATSGPFVSSLSEKFDGILGLATCAGLTCQVYRDLPQPVIPPILESLQANQFSFYLDRTGDGEGEITFGGTNPSLYNASTLTMHPTGSDFVWTVVIDSVWVEDQLVVDYRGQKVEAYIDTGTTMVIGPPADVNAVLRAANLFTTSQVACNRIQDLPSISFVIGGKKYTLDGKDYASVRTKPLFGDEICYTGLEGLQLGRRAWILGDVFMGKFYTVFQTDGAKAAAIGFADLL